MLPMYISSYACKHFQSDNLSVNLYLGHFFEHNEKGIGATVETYVPLQLSYLSHDSLNERHKVIMFCVWNNN